MRGSVVRAAVAAVTVGALVLAGGVTEAEASPLQVARRTAAATLAEVRAAAAVQEVRVREETKAPDPVAEGTVRPDASSTVDADGVGASVTFSGNKVDSDLTVTVGAAPANARAAAQAERPDGGVPVSDPIQVIAKDSAGKERTQFPAKRVKTRGGGKEGPLVSDVVPGVSLSLKPDLARMKDADIDPASLKIYTRENPGDPWTVLPSYFDAKAKVVKGVSSHLSQFVVIGIKFVPPPGPVIVLDPDNDEGRATTPAPPVSELGYNIRLAQLVKAALETDCRARVRITREDPADPFVPREVRAGIMANENPVLSLGIGFNTNQGTAWGTVTEGGSQVYSRGGAADDALSNSLVGVLPTYTGRPAKNMGNNGNFPGDEFAGVPGAFTHLEPLFLDHNFDRVLIDDPAAFQHLADGVLTGLGVWLESQGFDCTDPVTGGWPAPPSKAELERWRNLGHQNYLTYGGDPVSFSTGNLVEDEHLFTLPGPGGSSTDVTLTYNSQDGRLSRVGAGWSFGLGARAQRFDDGSVLVVRGDGASRVFTANGSGGYVAEPGQHQALTEQPGGRLQLRDVSGETWLFEAGDIEGIGELVSHTDANGNTTGLGYGAADEDVHQFVPLSRITAPGGQVIEVQSDAVGRVTGFTRPGGDHWGLTYDGAGNLTAITLPDGRTHAFSYDGAHQLLTATDATGATYLRNEYDAQGRVVTQWDAAGKQRLFDYSKDGQTAYTDNLGRVSVFSFDAQHRITRVVHPDGTTSSFTFDGEDNVTSSIDEAGAVTKNTYDASGNLTAQTLPSGQVVKYTYTPTGRVATRTDAGGAKGAARTWSYDYDGAGRLTAVRQPDGTTIANRYDTSGNVVATVQPSGATTTFGYDGAGHLISSTDPTGAVSRFAHDAAGRMVSRTDPNGNTTSYGWDSGDRLASVTDAAGGVTRYEWEANDHLAAQTDPTGATSRYEWDALFHLTASTNPLGGVAKYGYDAEDALTRQTDPLGAVTAFVTDSRNRVTQVTDPNGGVWKRQYDKVGNLVSVTSPTGGKTGYAYDAAGNLVSVQDAAGGTTTYGYDAVGRLTKETDADGVSRSYAYDLLDRVASVADGSGRTTRFAYDSDGNLTSVTGRDGQVTAYAYDAAGRLTTVTTPLGEVTAYAYDPAGNRTTVTDPLGRATTLTYTPLNQVASVTDPAGDTVAYAYDGNGRPASVTDANGNTTAYTYTANGDQATVTDATGAVTVFGWDKAGQQTSVTDPNGNVTVYAYDPAGLLTQVTEGYKKGAAPASDVNVVTKFGYDKSGNLTGVTDPNGHTTRYAVDAVGRTVSEVNAVGNTTRTRFTPAGRISSTTTGTGAVIANTYDKRGDLATRNAGGGLASFEYDAEQRLIAVTDSTGVSGFVYDKDGRVTTQIDQAGGRLTTRYDKAGQATGLTLPTGQDLSYTYDQAGRPTSQTSPWGSLTYAWDPAGRLTEQARSTGVATTYGYDPANRVTAVTHTTPEPAAASTPSPTPTQVPYAAGDEKSTKCTSVAGYLAGRTPPAAGESKLCKHANAYLKGRTLPVPENPVPDGGALAYTYQYDKAGNTLQASRTITGAPPTGVSYAYDHLNRLTASVTKAGEKNTYAYDAAGNRTGWERSGAKDGDFTQTATFTDANQLARSVTSSSGRGVSAGEATYSYDAAGNRVGQSIAGVSTGFGYNPFGQTTTVTRDGRTTGYGYDGIGRRVTATDATKYGEVTTRTTYDGATPVQEADQTHGTTTMIRDAAGRLAQHVTGSGSATWDLLDALGSTVAGATGGSITELASYDDWGGQRFETSAWSADEAYTGETTDPTEGLNRYHARSYDPAAGSWTSPDPWRGMATQPKSLHRYAYTENNPTTFIDVGGFRIGDPSAYNTKNPMTAYAMRQVDNATNYQIAVSKTKAVGVTPPAKPKIVGPTWDNDSAWRHAVYESNWPVGVNCDQQVRVGSTKQQLAINEACAKALSKASISTQPKWVQDLYYANQAFADAATPWVIVGIAVIGGSGVAGTGQATRSTNAYEYSYQTQTMLDHLNRLTKSGEIARPYMRSQLTIQEIMNAGTPRPDPGGIPGGLRWDVPGSYKGSSGTWELVVDPAKKSIVHFLFNGKGAE
ncbi:hypothetical protein DOE76_08080 [Leifsonia sp. ku-ls]|nr:hypothetical protein DOE76_08080 [Leifsonia sp. ku-ls]